MYFYMCHFAKSRLGIRTYCKSVRTSARAGVMNALRNTLTLAGRSTFLITLRTVNSCDIDA